MPSTQQISTNICTTSLAKVAAMCFGFRWPWQTCFEYSWRVYTNDGAAGPMRLFPFSFPNLPCIPFKNISAHGQKHSILVWFWLDWQVQIYYNSLVMQSFPQPIGLMIYIWLVLNLLNTIVAICGWSAAFTPIQLHHMAIIASPPQSVLLSGNWGYPWWRLVKWNP